MAGALIVANLRSGSGRARDALPLVISALERAGREHEVITTPTGEATSPLLTGALRASASRFDQVIVVGGDGTINGAVNGIMGSGMTLPLGIVPGGTGNEIVRSLGIPKDPEKAVEIALNGRLGRLDVGKVNSRYFLNIFGVGYDVQVVKMVNTLRSRYRFARNRSIYYLAALLLLSSGFDPFPVEVRVGEWSFTGRAIMIAAANGRMYGNLRSLPAPSISDGLLDLYLLRELRSRPFRKTARLLRRLPVPELSVHQCSAVRILLDQRREAQVDGSLLGPSQLFDISLLPRHLTVMLPEQTVPVAVAPRQALATERW